jgi:hypothetical protein
MEKTLCNHFLCKSCTTRLINETCPYCRQYIQTWEYQDILIPFYFFTEILYEHYRKNETYHMLKIGAEIPNVLSDNIDFSFHNPFANCPFTENYDKTITIRCYNLSQEGKKTKIEFRTLGLDNERSRHYYRSLPETYPDYQNLLYWILKNKKIRSRFQNLCKN